MASLVVLTVLILCSLSATQACMCWPSHPQNKFCKADFVVRAHIINVTDGPLPENMPEDFPPEFLAPQVYAIRIVKTFKGEDAILKSKRTDEYGSRSKVTEANLYTPSRGMSCGIPLRIGSVYLLSGTLEEGTLHMSFCDWWREWHRLTKSQRTGIRHNYPDNCHCQVGSCYGRSCSEKLKGCGRVEWYPRIKEVCKSRYTFCKAVSDKQCQWVQTAQYSRCWEDTL